MSRTRKRYAAAAVVVAVVLAPAVAFAAAGFDDVSESSLFKDDIAWMAETEVTVGCNAGGTDFCPGDGVTREQMSAFMHRLAQYFGETAYEGVVDGTNTIDGTATSSGTAETMASLTLPEGAYSIVAAWSANGFGGDTSARVVCDLAAGTSSARAVARVGFGAGEASQHSMSTTTVAEIGEGGSAATLACWTENLTGSAPFIGGVNIVATPAAKVSSTDATP